ncbi:hypothetical protein HMPREF0321_2443 [Dermacoccus sp. Ellin185]|nr:hypothetical protein HMPREF0321_2443 [Dermacoccus sp. Ellin185]
MDPGRVVEMVSGGVAIGVPFAQSITVMLFQQLGCFPH